MSFEQQQREALHLLRAIEGGTVATSEVAHLIGDADPALVYLILAWLRAHYGGDHPAGEGVLGRLVELSERHPAVKKVVREGEADSVVRWFESEYAYRDFDAPAFIELAVEKLEG